MIKYIKTFLLSFLIILVSCSQPEIEVIAIQQLELPDSLRFTAPQFSPSGQQILLTSPGYKGLWLYNIKKNSQVRLNELRGAGYQTKFSSEGQKVAFRYDTYINRLRHSSLTVQNISTKEMSDLIKEERNLSVPLKFKNNKLVYLLDDKPYIYDLKKKTSLPYSKAGKRYSGLVTYSWDKNLIVLNNGNQDTLNPCESGHYIWTSAAPDNNKLLFTCTGAGTFVSDDQGNVITKIENASAPQWSPDSKWILYTKQKDDGHRITASDIFVKSADGEYEFQLTATPEKIELHPAWSPSGDKIVYETDNYDIEVLQISK